MSTAVADEQALEDAVRKAAEDSHAAFVPVADTPLALTEDGQRQQEELLAELEAGTAVD